MEILLAMIYWQTAHLALNSNNSLTKSMYSFKTKNKTHLFPLIDTSERL